MTDYSELKNYVLKRTSMTDAELAEFCSSFKFTLARCLQDYDLLETALIQWNAEQTNHAQALIMHGFQLAARSQLGTN